MPLFAAPQSSLHSSSEQMHRLTRLQPRYTLLHAAASYNHTALVKTLVHTHNADPNIADTDGDTPLFYAETPAAALCLVDECGADWSIRNEEGVTAEDNALANVEDGDSGSWVEVAEFLERCRKGGGGAAASVNVDVPGGGAVSNAQDGDIGNASLEPAGVSTVNGVANPETTDVHPPPPLPPNVRINLGTMSEEEQSAVDGAPDPEFRRRIEELAAREDFQSAEGQEELRRLVMDAVGGLREDEGEGDDGRNVRRRT